MEKTAALSARKNYKAFTSLSHILPGFPSNSSAKANKKLVFVAINLIQIIFESIVNFTFKIRIEKLDFYRNLKLKIFGI